MKTTSKILLLKPYIPYTDDMSRLLHLHYLHFLFFLHAISGNYTLKRAIYSQTLLMMNLSMLSLTSSICIDCSVKQMDITPIFLSTWKIFRMCVANSLVSFQCWDELIDKHVAEDRVVLFTFFANPPMSISQLL